MTKVHTLTHTHTRDTGAFTGAASAISTKHFITLTTHGHRVERRRRRQRHAWADGFGGGRAATAWAAAALSARACRLPSLRTARARSGTGKRGGAGKRGGGDGGGGGSGTRGRTGSDGAEQRPPGRPLLRLPRARRLRSSSAVRRREAWRRAERDCRCRGAAVMWRGGRTTSARRTGRSSSASRAALKSRPKHGGFEPALRSNGPSNAREICFGAKRFGEFCHEKNPLAGKGG